MSHEQLFESLSAIEIVALTIIGEARGEPIEGQVAVGCVIRNRLYDNPGKYRSYHDVCLARLQFSCWNLNDPNYPKLKDIAMKLVAGQKPTDSRLKQCFFVAQGVVNWDLIDNTKSAINYMTTSLFESQNKPNWANNPKNLLEIGNHSFFTA